MALGRKAPLLVDDNALLEELNTYWNKASERTQQRELAHSVRPARRVESVTIAEPRRNRAVQTKHSSDKVDRLISEGFALLLSLGLWGVNALFTITGLLIVGIPWPVGLLCHIGISKGEHNIWKGRLEAAPIAFGLTFLLIDIGSTTVGLLETAHERTPDLLGTMPADLTQWIALAQ